MLACLLVLMMVVSKHHTALVQWPLPLNEHRLQQYHFQQMLPLLLVVPSSAQEVVAHQRSGQRVLLSFLRAPPKELARLCRLCAFLWRFLQPPQQRELGRHYYYY
jgi:hypothetical protein